MGPTSPNGACVIALHSFCFLRKLGWARELQKPIGGALVVFYGVDGLEQCHGSQLSFIIWALVSDIGFLHAAYLFVKSLSTLCFTH